MARKSINCLKDTDIYSLSMFALYKLTEIPEYSLAGELPYILDRTNLLNFCNYFGGRTIKIPTLDELYSVMHIVLLYQYTKIEGKDYDEAIKLVGFKSSELRKVKAAYNKVCQVIDKYKFGRTTDDN